MADAGAGIICDQGNIRTIIMGLAGGDHGQIIAAAIAGLLFDGVGGGITRTELHVIVRVDIVHEIDIVNGRGIGVGDLGFHQNE